MPLNGARRHGKSNLNFLTSLLGPEQGKIALVSLTFGIAPDSWGVWLPSSDKQPPWSRFLDEVASAGFLYIELGAYGYLPTDNSQLQDELDRRGLRLLSGTQISPFHSAAQRRDVLDDARRIAGLVAPLGGTFMVGICDGGGPRSNPRKLDKHQWIELIRNSNEVGRVLRDEFGLTFVFHPHADGVVEYPNEVDQYLADTDPSAVQLCLDTGHYEYRDGDSVELFKRCKDRIPFLHLKSVNSNVLQEVEDEDSSFGEAVARGVISEPSVGKVDFRALAAAMNEASYDGWAVVEHDIHPLPNFDIPLPIASRSKAYYEGLGWKTQR